MNIYDINETTQAYFDSLSKYQALSKEEEKELIAKYKKNNDISARNKVIDANLKYVCSLASKYRGRGLSYSDLISEGNDGLIESIENYDIERDVKVFSYAKWNIIQKMQIALAKKDKMPLSELPQEYNNNVPKYNDDDDFFKCNKEDIYEDFLEETFHDDCNSDSILLDDICTSLNDRERDIINMYYGRGYLEAFNLEEIGKKYNITRERVRQIMEKSFTKMRSYALITKNCYVSS